MKYRASRAMRSVWMPVLLFVAAAALAVGPASAQAIVNGSFEMALAGWTVNTSGGGSATTPTSATLGGCCTPPHTTTFTPVDGSHFALIQSGAADVYQRISQTFTALSGQTLAGWA